MPLDARATIAAAALALAGGIAMPASAATLLDEFTFTDGFTNTGTGTATATGDGVVTADRYEFDPDQGLTVDLGTTTLTEWSIVFSGRIDQIFGYVKLIDLSGLSSDNGLYSLNGLLNFYNSATGPTATISAGVDFLGVLTYDGIETCGYVDGFEQFCFDFTDVGYPDALSSFVMFQDDTEVPGETSAGSLDFLRVYDGALTGQEVSDIAGVPSPVPLPAAGLLLLGGLAALGAVRKRRQKV